MAKSKAWDWQQVQGKYEIYWKEPSSDAYYLISRWLKQGKCDFLDLGCGLGRHSIMFAKANFNTFALDLSKEALKRAKIWALAENLNIDFRLGDMLNLPFDNETIDAILAYHVISHTDTPGMIKIISELYRVLRVKGECYVTLGSKDSWGFKEDWPVVDCNTKIRIEDGPDNEVPHFYADVDLIFEMFKNFNIINLKQVEDIEVVDDKIKRHHHYHALVRKK